MNALMKTETTALATMSEGELLDVLQSSLYPGANPNSIRLALGYCKAAGLDPMQKPVHIVPMWDNKAGQMRDVVMPGVGLYRTQAARSGCAGVSEPEFGPVVEDVIGGQGIKYPQWARVTVKRRLASGEMVDFTAKEFWIENYAVKGGKEKSIAPNAMWLKRPYGQIAKCAEAQALRKAFPEIGAAPTADEMEGKTYDDVRTTIDAATVEVVGKAVQAAEPLPPYGDEKFKTNLPAWRKAMAEGRATAENIIAKLQTSATLTPEQVKAISEKPPVDHMARLNEAKTIDELNERMGALEPTPDLNAAYDKRLAELSAKYEARKVELQ